MKIKRFVAPDMRQAIAAVKREIGEDAVILSNKSVDNGVELIAAIDFDAEQFNKMPERPKKPASKKSVQTRQPPRPEFRAGLHAETASSSTAIPDTAIPDQAGSIRKVMSEKLYSSEQQLDQMEAMRREMQAMRRMMQNELSDISWREMGANTPESKELFRQLMNMGLSADISERLMNTVPRTETFERQWHKALYHLSAEIAVTGDDLTDQGGIVAVVGPTGVGKTTSIAKLAARYCLRHGNRHVALVSTDNYRIGAREQLHTYGRILNVPVRTAANVDELAEVLEALSDKRMILIDTAGMSHQDVQLGEQLAMLDVDGRKINRFLALSATTELSALKRAISAFSHIRPDACLLTKTDEAASLGPVLSAIIHSGLPLAYYTDGQRVPEDMHVARSKPLVTLAASLAEETSEQQGDGYLALALSGARAHAYY